MRNKSIRFKLTLWFSLVLILIVGLTFFAIRVTSGMVLRGTIRDYLISTVEENVNQIKYTETEKDPKANIYIPYKEGYLEVDTDFMDVVNDVHTALYTADGAMLYGENPLSKETEAIPFTESYTWHMKIQNVRYDLYDRKLNITLPDSDTIWIRGIVPETKSAGQLKEITRISLILLPILIALAVLSGYLLADRMLSPIRKIEVTAEQISRGDDLKRRIDVGKNQDEVGRLAKVFNRMLDRLEGSFESERQFTSDASHELRTPTSVILAQCEYTLEKERSVPEYEEALRVVEKQGKRMNALIGDMLDYTRMDQGTKRYPFERADLSQIVWETAEQMKMIGTKGITLQTKVEPNLEISGNRMLLSRMVQNLISNAYRYGKENGTILVALQKVEDKIILSVKDDGIGIAKEEQEKIFDRFYRSDASRSIQGTGLGLSMVDKIAKLHDAAVKVESEPGKGSTFFVIF